MLCQVIFTYEIISITRPEATLLLAKVCWMQKCYYKGWVLSG